MKNPTLQLINKPIKPLKPILTKQSSSVPSSMTKINNPITTTTTTQTTQPTTSNSSSSVVQEQIVVKSSQDSDHHSLSSQHSSSWWSWFSISSNQPIPNHSDENPSDDQINSDEQTNPIHDETSIDASREETPPSYVSRLGNWAYSWVGETPKTTDEDIQTELVHPTTTNLIDTLLPNPVVASIPLTGQGWASYFSSRRSLPIHKLHQDNQSVESMPIELSSPESSQSDQAPNTTSLKNRPQSVMDLSKNWLGIKKNTISLPSDISNDRMGHLSNESTSSSKKITTIDHQQTNIPPLTDNLSPQTLNQIRKGKRVVIPNLVLPTFEDTFNHPPRSFLPHNPSKLKNTLELVQAFVYSKPSSPIPISITQFPQTTPNEVTLLSEENPTTTTYKRRKRRSVLQILEDNRHISTKLPKSLDLLGIDRIERLEKIQTVTIVGIHGWFPGPWLESVLGKPTGTSHKFTSMMDSSLRRYIEKELGGKKLNQDFIRIINLEGEGRVDDRVEKFYKELINHPINLNFILNSDVVFFVSHSQGCLVSCKLIEKLLLLQFDNSSNLKKKSNQFLSLSMCGIWNGPYVGLNFNFAVQPVLKLFEGPAAHELFEFQNPHSSASIELMKSFKNTLKLGVKHVLIGSMNDQVVPIYSSINNLIDHPSILRGIFIDSAVYYYSPTDFLTNLIVFCLRLRNSGLSDHGLLFLLSDYFVGGLTGVGHSTIYEDQNVFDLAVRYFFETSTPLEAPTYTSNNIQQKHKGGVKEEVIRRVLPDELSSLDQSTTNPKEKPNPFLLTWSLRGLIEDHKIKLLFYNELIFLKKSFLIWNPSADSSNNNNSNNNDSSKILKDLKMKLQPFREVRLNMESSSLLDRHHHLFSSKL